jgi:predicted outer membrane protein
MSKRLLTGMVLALAVSTAAPVAVADDLMPADIAGPVEWGATQEAMDEAIDAAKASIDASKAALEASKAAQAVGEDSLKKVEALTASITSSMASLKANMASLNTLLSRIAKKLGA